VVFGTIYGLLSLGNHYAFNTNAWDLGIFINALHDYSHGRLNGGELTHTAAHGNLLSDHLELLMLAFAPIQAVFGAATLLVVQMLFVLFGGVGIYRLVRHWTGSPWRGLTATVHFFSLFGVFGALAFDYHNNVVAACFLPWAWYALETQRYKWLWVFVGCMLLTKETTALLVLTLGVVWALRYRGAPRWQGVWVALVSVVWFVLATKLIMPANATGNWTYAHFRYSLLGENGTEALITLVTRPFYALKNLFISHNPDPHYTFIKVEFWVYFLLGGGLFFFVKPRYWLIALPLLAQKLFNDDPRKWGILYHYNIELTVLMALATAEGLGRLPSRWFIGRKRTALAWGMAVLAFAATHTSFFTRYAVYQDKHEHIWWQRKHFAAPPELAPGALAEVRALVPADAVVAAHIVLVPHLAERDVIYVFPDGVWGDEWPVLADYVIVSDHPDKYPFEPEYFEQMVQSLAAAPDWEMVLNRGGFRVLKRKGA